MTKKNIMYFLALFMVLFVAVGAASAATDSDIVASDVNDNNGVTESISNGGSDNGTFTDLNTTVNDALSTDGYLELNKDYVYNDSQDSALKEGITISKDLRIAGNSHTIDGSNLARMFNIQAGVEVCIEDVTFINGNNVTGGAIKNLGSLTISNCYFIDNCKYYTTTATEIKGGAIYSGEGSSLYVYGSKFRGNGKGSTFIGTRGTEAGSINGGAICTEGAKKVVIDNNLFDGNLARWGSACQFIDSTVDFKNSNVTNSEVYSGALYVNGKASITNCKFENNTAKFVGSNGYVASGADICIVAFYDTDITVDQCTFNNSKVTSPVAGAGSLHVETYNGNTSKVNIKNSKFTNVNSPDRAAVFAKGVGSTLTIENVEFDSCSAKYGGAIYVNDSSAYINYCNFTNCSAKYGGAIYAGVGSTLNINNSIFRKNCDGAYNPSTLEADTIEGGAIYTDQSTVVIDNTLFDENTGRWGSACQFNGGNVEVTNCNVTNNYVYSGAFYINANTKLTNCKFDGNDAKFIGTPGYKASGADIFICSWSNYDPEVVIDGCTFSNSKVTSSAAGAGSIQIETKYNTNSVDVTIKNSKFTNATSPERAAVFVIGTDCTLTVENVEFEKCSAKNGVVIDVKGATSTLNVTGCTFTNNTKYVTPNAIANGGDANGVITSAGTSYLAGNNFTDNDNNAILANLNGATATIGEGNTVNNGSYIVNNGTLNGARAVLGEPLVATQINNETNQSINTITLTASILTDSGNILVIDNKVNNATVLCDNEQSFTLESDGKGIYSSEEETFDANDGIKLYGTSLTMGNYAVDNGNILPTSAPDGSLSQLKEVIDAWTGPGDLTLSSSYSYNASCDSEITTIVLNKTLNIVGNDGVGIDTTGSNVVSLFTITDGVAVSISNIDFDSDAGVSDICVENGTLTVSDCTSDNVKSIYLKGANAVVKNANITVLENGTAYTGTGIKTNLNATASAGGLSVYSDTLKIKVGSSALATTFENGVYYANYTTKTKGVYTVTTTNIDAASDNILTGTLIVLGSSDMVINTSESVYQGNNLTINVTLDYYVPGTVAKLYITNNNPVTIDIDDFVLGTDNKYHYSYNLTNVSNPVGTLSIMGHLNLDKVILLKSEIVFVNVLKHLPELEVISVSGNYSTKVNITVKGNYTEEGDLVVLHHIDGYNITAKVDKNGTATFTDVLLSKAGNYVTEIIYGRTYDTGYYYVANTTVNWNISKISTNVTFSLENITSNVNKTNTVIVTVKDYYNNTVKSGQITVTGEGIKLLDVEGNPYNGTVYNLTNGAVTVYFKYLSEGVYTPNFAYTNPNSTYSNNNNYFYSNASLSVNITKANVNITVDVASRNVSGRVYDNITITGNVTDENGLIPVGNVTITVNNVVYNSTVNSSNGGFKFIINSTSNGTWNDTPVKFISGNTTMWNNTDSTSPNLVNVTVYLISTNVTVNPVAYNKSAGEAFNITGNVTTINSTVVPTGKVAIKINGTTYDAYLNADGTYSIPVTVNNSGTWNNLNVTFTSNQTKVLANNVSGNIVNVTINNLNTTINITDIPAEYVANVNETFIINGTVTASNGENVTGNVTITVNGQNFTANVENGVFHLNVNSTIGLAKAAYNITFTSNNATRWNNCTGVNIVNITVNKLNTTINITTDKIIVVVINQTYYINGTVTDDVYHKGVAGNVTVKVNGQTLTVATGVNGTFSISNSSALPFGPLNCTISFGNFNESVYNAPGNESVNITVNKLNTTIKVISTIPEAAYVGQNITITGNVTDDFYNKSVSGVVVSITVKGKVFNYTTGKDGSFTLNVTSDEAIANTTYVISGNLTSDIYNTPKSANASFEFMKLPTIVTVDPITYEANVNTTIYVNGTVKDAINGNPANGTVFIKLNGVEFNITVGTDGNFSIPVSCNVSGIYEGLYVRFNTTNDKYWENNCSASDITITIKSLDVLIISDYDGVGKFNTKYDRIRSYTFNVTDSMGNKVQNGTAYLYLDGDTYEGNVSNGQVTFKNISFSETGLHSYFVDYEGNAFYNYAFNFTNINVSKIATYIKINSSVDDTNKVLNISVYENDTKNLVKKGVIYYVTPDGVEHSKELVNGTAIVTFDGNRTGEYIIAVSYYDLDGDYLYSTKDFKYNITTIVS